MNTPIVVEEFPYKVVVERRGELYNVRLEFAGFPESILNSFIGHTQPLLLGRALVLACGPEHDTRSHGWDWHVADTVDLGYLTYKDERALPSFPTEFTGAVGYEIGTALLYIGLVLEVRRELKVAIAQMSLPRELEKVS